MAPVRPKKINNYIQDQQKQYGIKHRVMATIHSEMGGMIKNVALWIVESMLELWYKA